jgi:hypothetical protein
MSGANIAAGTIPSSAISGGISVSLPTTTMSALTATQIGFTQTGTFNSGMTINNGAGGTIGTLTLNGPVGSVWLVNAYIQNTSCGNGLSWACQLGSQNGANTYGPNGWPIHSSICGTYHKCSSLQVSSSGVAVISSATYGNLLVLGAYAEGSNLNIHTGLIRATRIA